MAPRPGGRPDPFARFLSFVERAGNALPRPAVLFLIFVLLVIVVSES